MPGFYVMDISNLKLRKIVFDKYSGKCAYCGCDLKTRFTIDHIQPKLRKMWYSKKEPGSNKLENYNPCCQSCNSSKNTLTIEDWRTQIKHKIFMLNRDSSTYRLAKRFGLIKETGIDVTFYFESHE